MPENHFTEGLRMNAPRGIGLYLRRGLVGLAVAGAVAAGTNRVMAYDLANFEGGIQGYNPAPSGGATTSVIVAGSQPGSSVGDATTPTHVLDVNVPQGNFWGQRSRNLVTDANDRAALIANNKLEYDMTLNQVALSGGNPSFAGFAQSNELAVTMFSPSGINLFIQRNFGTGGATDSLNQNAQWNGVDGTRHITWNLTNFTANDPLGGGTKTVAQLLIDHPDISEVTIWNVAQSGNDPNAGNADFFFDSYVLTPEPGSLALLGLLAPAVMRRGGPKRV
jgi:hypothetical protein